MADQDGQGDRDRASWVDLAVRAAPYLGLNPVRVRWRLERWRQRRAEARRRLEQRIDHIRYQHKTCHECGAVQDRDAAVCSRCGAKLGRRSFQVLRRLGIFAPEWISMSSLLGVLFAGMFARTLVASAGGMGDLFGLDVGLLYRYGGHYPPAVAGGEYWRLLTACFLHAGLIHLGFNLFSLAIVGPQVEALYGRLQMLFLFVATGVLANIGSGLVGLHGVGIGASGGLMGLIGVAAGWGQRQGTTQGRAVRNDMLKWSAYIVLFGLFVGADNWAHLFGLLCGFGLGFAVRPDRLRQRALAPVRALTAVGGIAGAILAVALILRPPGGAAAFAGHIPQEMDMFEICRLHWRGDHEGALAQARQVYSQIEDYEVDGAMVTQLCDALEKQLAMCRDPATEARVVEQSGARAVESWRIQCALLERAHESATDR